MANAANKLTKYMATQETCNIKNSAYRKIGNDTEWHDKITQNDIVKIICISTPDCI